jgi:hypothetical protein
MIRAEKTNIIALLLIIGLAIPLVSNAQYFRGSRYWKEYRKEISVAIGTSQVLSDLGGRDQVGSDFLYDMELNKTRIAASVGYRYYLKEKIAFRGNISYAMLQGDDALTVETYRSNRNLNFKTPVVEGAAILEYHFTSSPPGHRYKLKGARGKKHFKLGTYAFGGVGAFWFDPRALDGTRLKPLHTEGQGSTEEISYVTGSLPSNIKTVTITAPKQYSSINMSFPLGLGLTYGLDQKWSVGLRLGWRFTTTDYLDDASGVYWKKADQSAETVKYADPSFTYNQDFLIDGDENKDNYTEIGQQRGDPTDRDNYGFAQLTLNYKLVKKKKFGRGRRIKTRKSMPSF